MTSAELLADKLGLDTDLKHIVLISGRPYITRDGYLHIAHASQVLDGIEVIEESEDSSHWIAKVAVWRKDMGRPFTYVGRYPKSGQQKKYGPEMAVKTAEVAALRRAFDVTGAGAADEMWDDLREPVTTEPASGWVTRASDLQTLSDRASELEQPVWEALKAEHPGWHVDQEAFHGLLTAVTTAATEVAGAGDNPPSTEQDEPPTSAPALIEGDAQ